jgi:hypothetical protein
MRLAFIFAVFLAFPAFADAEEPKFELDLDHVMLEPPPEPPQPGPSHSPRKKARMEQWNDPMTRWMYQFNQLQAWTMRGATPGADRIPGAVVSVSARPGLPLRLVAQSQIATIDMSEKEIDMVRWPWEDDEGPPVMELDEQLSLLLGRRLDQKK